MVFLALFLLLVLAVGGLVRGVRTSNPILGLAASGLLFILVGLIWLFGPYFALFTLLPLVKAHLVGLGINPWLGSAIGIVMTVGLIVALSYVLSLSPRNRQIGFGIFVGLLLADVGAGWLVQRGFWFDPQGNPLVTYSPDPVSPGVIINHSRGVGVDRYGQPKRPVPPELAQRIVQVEIHGARAVPLEAIKDDEWFSAIDGRSLIWYSEPTPGQHRLFRHSGYDPLTGQVLRAVTPALVAKIQQALPGITGHELSTLKANWKQAKRAAYEEARDQGQAAGFARGKEEGRNEAYSGAFAVCCLLCGLVGYGAFQAGRDEGKQSADHFAHRLPPPLST